MSWYRWLWCTLLLVVVDGVLLFLLLGLLAFMARLARAPLSFAVCAGLLAAAVLSVATRHVLARRWPAGPWPEVAAGAVAVWLAVATQAGLAWPAALLADAGTPRAAPVLALLAAVWLWRHGIRRARAAVSVQVIARSFRSALVAFVLVLALETAGDLDLGTRAVLVPFFAASLAGMALARAPPQRAATRAWLAVVAGSVAVVVVAGLVLATVAVVVLRGGGAALGSAWRTLAAEITASVGATLEDLFGGGSTGGLDLQGPSLDIPEAAVVAVLLAGGVVVALLSNRLLDAPRAAPLRVVTDLGEEEREAIAARDSHAMQELVDSALPAWLRRPARRRRPYPREPGADGIYTLYHRLLDLARERGVQVRAAHTPFERARQLRRELPQAPVDAITRRFVAARYGGEATPPEALAALARELEAAGRG